MARIKNENELLHQMYGFSKKAMAIFASKN